MYSPNGGGSITLNDTEKEFCALNFEEASYLDENYYLSTEFSDTLEAIKTVQEGRILP